MLSYGKICDRGGMSGGEMHGRGGGGGMSGSQKLIIIYFRHKQLMFVIQSSVRLLKFSSTIQ